jgi:hypothetical protein
MGAPSPFGNDHPPLEAILTENLTLRNWSAIWTEPKPRDRSSQKGGYICSIAPFLTI